MQITKNESPLLGSVRLRTSHVIIPTKIHACLFVFVCALTFPNSTVAQGDGDQAEWSDIAKLLPATANAILVIDAEAMFQSELAIRNDWRESHAEHFDRNPTMLPPVANRFILSSELDTEHFEPTRELAVISTSTPISYEELRERIEGEADTLAGTPSIFTSRNSYVVPINTHMVTLIRQAPRQWAAWQIRDGRDRTDVRLHKLLTNTIDHVDRGNSQIALAVFLGDAVSRSAMKAAIQRSSSLNSSVASTDQLVDEMMQLQGIVLTIDIDTAMRGSLEMVFDGEPTQLSVIAKPIMLEMLTTAGAVLPEFKTWQAVPGSKRLALQGDLSMSGLRRVLNLLSVEAPDFSKKATLTKASEKAKLSMSPEAIQARATANYVKRVTRLADAVTSGGKGSNLREQVLWTDRTAKSISRMTTRNVHYEAVKIGRNIAYGMLGIVSVFQEADQNARSRITSENPPPVRWHTEMIPYRTFVTPYGRYYRYRPFSYAQVHSEENAIRSRKIVSEELAKANQQAKKLLKKLEADILRLNQIL